VARHIFEHDAAGHAAEELEGGAVQAQPRLDGLVEDDLRVLVAAEGQRHHEDPGSAHAPALGIEELPGEAEVHLGLVTRWDFQAERGAGKPGRQPAQEALHRRVAASEAVLLDEELPDGWPSTPRSWSASTRSRSGATSDCSWAGRSVGAGSNRPASVAGSGSGPPVRTP
jgi:hypothetical protein